METVRAGRERVLGQPVLPKPVAARTKGQGWVFAGYIPLRRGILEHVQKGFLNKTDFSIYCLLLLLVDHHTGVWWGSGKALGLYNFPRSTAQKSLQRLESKGYIKRFPIPGVHSNYPILINKYAITDGQHKGLLLDTKQTTSTNRIVYVKQQVGEHLVEHVGEHVRPIQEGRIEKKEKRKNTAQALPSPYGWKHLRLNEEQIEKLMDTFSPMPLASECYKMDLWLDANPKRRKKNYYAFAVRWLNRITRVDVQAAKESAVGRSPLTERKPGKCKSCGKETVPRFVFCYSCIKKGAAVNP